MIYTVTLNPCIDKTVTLDRLRHGELNRVTSVRRDACGKAINVSYVLERLGDKSTALGFLAGNSGRLIEEAVASRGIEPMFIWVDGDTRTNLKVIEPDGTLTEINEPGPKVSGGQLTWLLDMVGQYLKEGDWLVISGSMPPGVPVGFYASLVETAKAKGAKAVVDSDGESLKLALPMKPDMVKPNLFELQNLFGRQFKGIDEVVEAARSLTEMGIRLVIISMGADGALFAADGECILARSEPVKVQSSVGCGDTLVAATVHSLIMGRDTADTARFAVAAATAKAMQAGTSFPTLDEIEQTLPGIKIVERRQFV